MVLIICTKNESNLTNRYWDSGQTKSVDRGTEWTHARTHAQRQNYIPPISSKNNKSMCNNLKWALPMYIFLENSSVSLHPQGHSIPRFFQLIRALPVSFFIRCTPRPTSIWSSVKSPFLAASFWIFCKAARFSSDNVWFNLASAEQKSSQLVWTWNKHKQKSILILWLFAYCKGCASWMSN